MTSVALQYPEWLPVIGSAVFTALAVLATVLRRAQRRGFAEGHRELVDAHERGSHAARLQYPQIDLNQCIGCGACVRACPEQGVLALLHGQAAVVHGARCVGHARCAAACPTGAISLTFGDLSTRRDLPALSTDLESVGTPGLFLAGEISGFALVRTAVSQGIAVADAVIQRLAVEQPQSARKPVMSHGNVALLEPESDDVQDLLIVGAGPGGIACALRARQHGLNFIVVEQASRIGGTVASYPRRKMVMTQPLDLPLYGRLPKLEYQKEDLIKLWEDVTRRHDLPIRLGIRLDDLSRSDDGIFTAITSDGPIRARNICLALGRRGSPRKLGVPGEDLPKVSYNLLDAASYRARRILVVGGGDSAIEAALGLSEQRGNRVAISYRKSAFFRLKARNDARISKAIHEGRVEVLYESQVLEITPDAVRVALKSGEQRVLANDDVFIFVGGDPPFALLERAGVSFDPSDRPAPAKSAGQHGLAGALILTMACAAAVIVWAVRFGDYYSAPADVRANSELHDLLRPGGPIGLPCALIACGLFICNLAYLLRRSRGLGRWIPGSLQRWMRWHVFTGLMATLFVLVHAGFMTKPTVGGHAMLVLGLVILSGSIGRYLYALVPRAANGTDASLEDLRSQLLAMCSEWDSAGHEFGARVRQQIDRLITEARWKPGLPSRVCRLIVGHVRLRRTLRRLRGEARDELISEQDIRRALLLARKAFRLTLLVTHYEEIAAILSSWRYFHRWLALLMVLLVVIHVISATRYAALDWSFLQLLSKR